jgi:hypothetical protein
LRIGGRGLRAAVRVRGVRADAAQGLCELHRIRANSRASTRGFR